MEKTVEDVKKVVSVLTEEQQQLLKDTVCEIIRKSLFL